MAVCSMLCSAFFHSKTVAEITLRSVSLSLSLHHCLIRSSLDLHIVVVVVVVYLIHISNWNWKYNNCYIGSGQNGQMVWLRRHFDVSRNIVLSARRERALPDAPLGMRLHLRISTEAISYFNGLLLEEYLSVDVLCVSCRATGRAMVTIRMASVSYENCVNQKRCDMMMISIMRLRVGLSNAILTVKETLNSVLVIISSVEFTLVKLMEICLIRKMWFPIGIHKFWRN